MLRIEGVTRGKIDVKRFYLPGIVAISNCPKCGKEHRQDLAKQYLCYPKAGQPTEIHFYCGDCTGNDDTEWNEAVLLKIELIPLTETTT